MKRWRNIVAPIILALCLAPTLAQAFFVLMPRTGPEHYPAYIEVDPNNRFAVIYNTITVTALTRNEEARIYRDMGIGHFNSNFTHYVDAYMSSTTAASGLGMHWFMANVLDDKLSFATSGQPSLNGYLQNVGGVAYAAIEEYHNNTRYIDSDSGGIAFNTPFYIIIVRDLSSGNGTLLQYVFSDINRTVLVASQSLALHADTDFRYVYAYNSDVSGAPGAPMTFTGWARNLDLREY